jgi:CBS domain-containing membrane protein
MSRDVISIRSEDTVEAARSLLLTHNLRTLPVITKDGRIEGTVGLRELEGDRHSVGQLMSRTVTVPPDYPALALIPTLTDGRTHAVVIVDDAQRVIGLITQTDLLAVLAGKLRSEPSAADLEPASDTHVRSSSRPTPGRG